MKEFDKVPQALRNQGKGSPPVSLLRQAAYLLASAFAREESSKLPASSQTFFTPFFVRTQ
jgi:hypothetical protein